MRTDFRFHPVGHGLFYSGVINTLEKRAAPIVFIYDCGGRDANGRFKAFWDSPKKKLLNGRLTLLVISHFHRDHISGVPSLIAESRPRFVVMPYLSPAERVACFAVLSKETDLDQKLMEDLGRLILAPEVYCEEYGCKLYLVDPDAQGEKLPENFDALSVGRISNELSFPAEKPKQKNGVEAIGNGAVGFLTGWKFIFFMPKKANNCQKIENWLSSRKISEQGDLSKSIDSGLFEKITKEFGDLELKNNGSNLVCVHGPVCDERKECVWVFHGDEASRLSCMCIRRRGWHDVKQMLTGDAEFDKVLNFSKWLSDDECNQIALFQVPHHGSPNNREDWFESQLPNCVAWVVPHDFSTKDRKNIFKINGTSGGLVYYVKQGVDVRSASVH